MHGLFIHAVQNVKSDPSPTVIKLIGCVSLNVGLVGISPPGKLGKGKLTGLGKVLPTYKLNGFAVHYSTNAG